MERHPLRSSPCGEPMFLSKGVTDVTRCLDVSCCVTDNTFDNAYFHLLVKTILGLQSTLFS